MKTYQSQFATDMKRPGAVIKYRVLLYYDNAQLFECWTHSNKQFSGTPKYGIVSSISGIKTGVNPITSVFEIPSVTIRIVDGEIGGTLASGLSTKTVGGYFAGKNFRNRDVKIYRMSENMTTTLSHDEEFVGITANYWYDNESKEWVFECVGNVAKYDKELPSDIVNSTDYPNAPKSSLGMPLPMVYGSFDMRSIDAPHNLYHLAPTVCIDKIAGTFAVSNHALDALSTGNVYVFLPGLGVYGGALGTQSGGLPTVSFGGSPATITLPLAEFYKLAITYLIPTMKGSINTVSDISDIVDNDENTTEAITGDYYAKFASLSGDGEFLEDATSAQLYDQIAAYCYVTAYSGANTSLLKLYNPDTGTDFSVAAKAFNTTGFKTSNDSGTTNGLGVATNRTDNTASGTAWSDGVTHKWSWEEIGRYEFGIDVGASVTCTISVCGIAINNLNITGASLDMYGPNLPRTRSFSPRSRHGRRSLTNANPYRVRANEYYPLPAKSYSIENGNEFVGFSSLFTECDGRPFGTWIDAVGRSNSYNAGDVVTSSNFVIESVLRDGMGVPTAEIDVDSFDAAETGAYDFIFSQNELISASELIQDLSFNSRCLTTCKSNGIWKILRMEDAVAASDVTVPYKSINIFNVSLMEGSTVINDVTVSYNYDYGKQQYTHDTNIEDTTSKGATASGTNRNSFARFESPFIRHSSDSGATNYAVLLRNYLIGQWAYPHREIEFSISDHELWGIEELDIIEFSGFTENVAGIGTGSSDNYWASFASPALKYWLVTDRESTNEGVYIKAMQLHDFS